MKVSVKKMMIPLQRTELIASMSESVEWDKFRNSKEAQVLHKKIIEAANLVLMLAPQALRPVRVKRM